MYYYLDEETFVETFAIFGFKGGMKDSNIDSSQQIKNMLILQIPNLMMIWIKSITGVRAWIDEFSRKSVETYYMYTFVFHSFAMISNTLMFSLQSQYYGEWILPNIISTVLIGGACIYLLHKFTLFKDKDQHLHQQLWCGDVVDSSDEEEKNANAKSGQ